MKNKKLLSQNQRLYHLSLPIIGLTGGVATGKSTVSNILKDKGIPVICADELIKKIYQKEDSKDFIQKNFGQVMLNNQIDFKKLRHLAFENKDHLVTLESFLYPQLEIEFKKKLTSLGEKLPYIIYDIPLMFEKNLQTKFDLSVVVYCPEKTQLERLQSRDQIRPELAKKMIIQQLSIENKKKLADYVIDNSSDVENLILQVDLFLASLQHL